MTVLPGPSLRLTVYGSPLVRSSNDLMVVIVTVLELVFSTRVSSGFDRQLTVILMSLSAAVENSGSVDVGVAVGVFVPVGASVGDSVPTGVPASEASVGQEVQGGTSVGVSDATSVGVSDGVSDGTSVGVS